MNVQSNVFGIILEKYDTLNNKELNEPILNAYLQSNETIISYFYILHDKDVDITGNFIRPHYHIIVYLNNKYSKKTIINDIACCLSCNKNIISVRAVDLIQGVCYLKHSEGYNKYLYRVEDIKTNDFNNLNEILNNFTCSYYLTIEKLIDLVNKCRTKSELYVLLGLKESKNYRQVINDLWSERKHI